MTCALFDWTRSCWYCNLLNSFQDVSPKEAASFLAFTPGWNRNSLTYMCRSWIGRFSTWSTPWFSWATSSLPAQRRNGRHFLYRLFLANIWLTKQGKAMTSRITLKCSPDAERTSARWLSSMHVQTSRCLDDIGNGGQDSQMAARTVLVDDCLRVSSTVLVAWVSWQSGWMRSTVRSVQPAFSVVCHSGSSDLWCNMFAWVS